jgi:hypothetical protein
VRQAAEGAAPVRAVVPGMTAALIPELALRITVGLLFLGWLVLCDTSEVTVPIK